MFRHQRRKNLFTNLIPSGEGPYAYTSDNNDEVVSFVREEQTAEGRGSIDNVHAPTDLTYLIDNYYDVDVSVQPIGGIWNNVTEVWEFVTEVGDPVVVAAGTSGYIDVFPGNPYMQDYGVDLTWAELGQGETGANVIAVYAIDQ